MASTKTNCFSKITYFILKSVTVQSTNKEAQNENNKFDIFPFLLKKK